MDYSQYVKVMQEFMFTSEREKAKKYTEELIASGINPDDIIEKIVDPVLVQQGRLWNSEEISLAQAYISAKIAEDILILCSKAMGEDEKKSIRATVVMGNIEDDFHSLGRKIVSIFLRANGFKVIDLGNDVPAEDLIDEAISSGAKIIGASAMMYTTALNIKKIHEELITRGLRDSIKVAAGGAVFNGRPNLVDEVCADGTAKNAFDSVKLMEKLLEELASAGR